MSAGNHTAVAAGKAKVAKPIPTLDPEKRRRRTRKFVRLAGGVFLLALGLFVVLAVMGASQDETLGSAGFTRSGAMNGDSATLVGEVLDRAQEFGIRFRVVGHTASQGDRLANLALGARRAETLVGALVDAGLPADQVVWESAGGEKPLECAPGVSPRACDLSQARAEVLIERSFNQPLAWALAALGALGVVLALGGNLFRRPKRGLAWPVKALGAGLSAGGLAGGVIAIGGDVTNAAVVGLGGFVLARLALSDDPVVDPWEGREVAEVLKRRIDKARSVVERIRRANDRIPCPELSAALDSLHGDGSRIIEMMEENPELARGNQRFLEVYLEGAAAVSEKYADVHRDSGSEELEESYREFLDRTIRTFEKQREALVADEVFDLDVEIEVLSKRMTSEGIS